MRKERKITFLDSDRSGPNQETVLDGGSMAKLLRWIVNTLERFCGRRIMGMCPQAEVLLWNLIWKCEKMFLMMIFMMKSVWRIPGCFGNPAKKNGRGNRTGVCRSNIPMA